MSDWKEYRLGDITDWSSGGTPSKKNDDFWCGDIPWISASSMKGNRYSDSSLKITDAGLKAGSRLATKDSILLLVRGSTLHQRILVGISTRDVAFNQDVKAIVPKEEFLDSWYLLFWFMSIEKDLLNMVENTGIGAGKLDTKLLQNLIIKIPPEEERERIKAFAKAIDDRFVLNRQTNQTLEQIAQTLFKSWFVDFDPVKAKIIAQQKGGNEQAQSLAAQAIICGAITLQQLQAIQPDYLGLAHQLHPLITTRFPNQGGLDFWTPQSLSEIAELFPNALVESELGEVPEGWEEKKVGDIVNRLKPRKRYTKKQVESFGKVPVLEQGADILLGFHNDEAGFNATPEAPLFVFGDHTCITHLSCGPFDISQNVIPLNGNHYPTIWVYYAVQGKQVFQEYRRHWSEFVIKEVVIPSDILANEYAFLVTALYKQKESLNRESETLKQIRDSLLPKLLSGKINTNPNKKLQAAIKKYTEIFNEGPPVFEMPETEALSCIEQAIKTRQKITEGAEKKLPDGALL